METAGAQQAEDMAEREGVAAQPMDQNHSFPVSRAVFDSEDLDGGAARVCVDLDELALGVMVAEIVREAEEPGAVVWRAEGRERGEEEGEEGDGDGEISPEDEGSDRGAGFGRGWDGGLFGGFWQNELFGLLFLFLRRFCH